MVKNLVILPGRTAVLLLEVDSIKHNVSIFTTGNSKLKYIVSYTSATPDGRDKCPVRTHWRQLKPNNLKLKLLIVKGLKPKTNLKSLNQLRN